MRTKKIWMERVRPSKIKQKFPPRIQKEILKYPPENIHVPITSMYIFGDIGSGKTLLSAWLLLKEEERMYFENINEDTYFLNTSDLFYEIKSTFGNSQNSEYDLLKKYREAHLLVLDDFGTVKSTDWVYQILYLIINHRYEYLKTTIINSNFDLDELEKILGDSRITSRIQRMGKVLKKL